MHSVIKHYFITLEKSRSLFYLGTYDRQDMFMGHKSVYIKSTVFLISSTLVIELFIKYVWVSIAPNILLLKQIPSIIIILNTYLLDINIKCQTTYRSNNGEGLGISSLTCCYFECLCVYEVYNTREAERKAIHVYILYYITTLNDFL